MNPVNDKNTKPKGNFLSANYKEIIATFVAFIAFYLITHGGIQAIDPTAGTTDLGVVDLLAFAFLALYVSTLAIWILWRVAFKSLHLYVDSKKFREEFFGDKVDPIFRIFCVLGFFAVCIWAIIQFAKLAAGIQ